jgi:hypothetical protein
VKRRPVPLRGQKASVDRGSQLLFGERTTQFRQPDGIDETHGSVGMRVGQVGKSCRLDDDLKHAVTSVQDDAGITRSRPLIRTVAKRTRRKQREQTEENSDG